MRILLVTAVPAERDAALSALRPYPGGRCLDVDLVRADTPAGELTGVAGGTGPAAAAACAATVLALDGRYDLAISAGIAGGFAGRAEPGQVVLADRVVLADVGAGSPDGFLSLDDLGLGESVTVLPTDLVTPLAARTGAIVGPVLTVATGTGTDERAATLADRYHPVAEAMEGGGVLAAARAHRVGFAELRAISNRVGRRDRGSWTIGTALTALAGAVRDLSAAALPT